VAEAGIQKQVSCRSAKALRHPKPEFRQPFKLTFHPLCKPKKPTSREEREKWGTRLLNGPKDPASTA